MALWVELHCDIKSPGPKDIGRLEPWCFSCSNNSPGILVSNDRISMMKGIRFLEERAVKAGWKRDSLSNWTCPNCLQRHHPNPVNKRF